MEPTIAHGHPIAARDVEAITSTWSDTRYVSLLNSLILASLSSPSDRLALTERVNLPGPDALIDLPAGASEDQFRLTGPGRTVFEFKRRDVAATNRRKVFTDQKGLLTKAATAAIAEQQAHRFVAIVNIELHPGWADELLAAIRAAAPGLRHVRILGAADLAAVINNVPHLRSAYFSTHASTSIQTFRDEFARRAAAHGMLWTDAPVGREDHERRLREALDNPAIRVVQIAGPPGLGKTRLAADVLVDPRYRGDVAVVETDRSEAGGLRVLASPRVPAIALIDRPLERAALRRTIDTVLGLDGLRAVLVLPEPLVSASQAIVTIELEPLSEADAGLLLDRAAPGLASQRRLRLIEQSAGRPALLLHGAASSPKPDVSPGAFPLALGREMAERLFGDPAEGPRLRAAARALSLVSLVRIAPEAGEVEALAPAAPELGGGGLRATVKPLLRAGVLAAHPSEHPVTIEVVPGALAAALAREAIERDPTVLDAIFRAKEGTLGGRLLRQLCEISDFGPARAFVAELLDARSGPYRSLHEMAKAQALVDLSAAFPAVVGAAFRNRVVQLGAEGLRALDDEARWSLRWALASLSHQEGAFADAAHAAFLLARHESVEDQPAPARGRARAIFAELLADLFALLNVDAAATFPARLEVLQRLWRESEPAGRAVLVDAIASIFKQTVDLPPAANRRGAERKQTWGDVWSYSSGCLGLLRGALEDPDGGVRALAGEHLGGFALEALERGVKDPALAALKAALESIDGIPPDRILELIAGIERLEGELPSTFGENPAPEWQSWRDRLGRELPALRERLSGSAATFPVRLRRALGSWHVGGRGEAPMERESSARQEAARLGAEAVDRELTDEELEWATSPEAFRSSWFFEALGAADKGRRYLARLRALSGRGRGAVTLATYVSAWPETDRADWLDAAAAATDIDPDAVVIATLLEEPDERARRRVLTLVAAARPAPGALIRRLEMSAWPAKLKPDALAALLRSLRAAEDPDAAMATVALLHMRTAKPFTESTSLRSSKAIADLAIEALEVAEPRHGNDEFEWAGLARVFLTSRPAELARILTASAARRGWATHSHDAAALIEELPPSDRATALATLLDRAADGTSEGSLVRFLARRVVAASRDADVLIAAGRRSVEHARAIVDTLSGKAGDAAFWQVAGALVAAYPQDEHLRGEVFAAVGSTGVVVGSFAPVWEHRAGVAEAYARASDTPHAAKALALEIADRLRSRATGDLVWEYEIRSDELRRLARAGTPEERRWATARILQQKQIEEALHLLSDVPLAEIREALPEARMDAKKRRAIEFALERMERRG